MSLRGGQLRHVRVDPVTDAPYGQDPRTACALDLRAEAGQVRLQPEEIGIRFGRPAGPRQQVMRNDVAGRPDERLEQAELGRGEDEPRLTDACLVAGRTVERAGASPPRLAELATA